MPFDDVAKVSDKLAEKVKEEIKRSSDTEDVKSLRRTSDRFDQLRKLDCFDTIRARLTHGHSTLDVARFIMLESGEVDKLTAKTESGIRDLLTDFRETLASTEIVSRVIPEAVKEAEKKLKDGVDEVKELEYLYLLQKDRIEIDFSTEKKINKLFKTTGNEVAIAMGILKVMSSLKQDLGLLKRDLGKLEVDHTMIADFSSRSPAIKAVMSDPSSRAKVLGLVRRLMERPDLIGEVFVDSDGAKKEIEKIESVRKEEIVDAEIVE